MRPIIEFCNSNMHHGTDAVMRELEKSPDNDVIEYGCLGNCGECYAAPFALVNGETVTADTPVELLHEIERKLKELAELDRLLDQE